MNKKNYRMIILLFLIIFIIFILYSNNKKNIEPEESYILEEYNFKITLSERWKEIDNTQYDLQFTNGNAYISIFVYFKNELAEFQIPLDVHKQHIDDLFSRRLNVEKISKESKREFEKKLIYSVLYSAEYNGVENYYYCNLIDFKGDADIFAWILFTALPSYSTENFDSWNNIIKTTEWIK